MAMRVRFSPTPTPTLLLAAALAGLFAAPAGLAPRAAEAQTMARADRVERGVLVATRPLRPGTVIGVGDVAVVDRAAPPGALTDPAQAIGLETKVSVYPGRPISAGALGAPTLVRRNDIVRISFKLGALSIAAEGRALDDGGLGQRVRVMNLDSRQTVFGVVAGPAEVVVK